MADKPPRVLFVEDDIGKRYVIARQLRAAGFDLVEAATGAEGLAKLSPEIDIAILDVKLPDMLGWDICKRIKQSPATASIMVLELSATLATAEDRARGLELGADAYLVHPVEIIELIATLRALYRLRKAERERERHRELFLGTVGHDLRNPLQTIVTATQVLAESVNLGAPERRTIATIERTAGRMRRLIDQLLIFTQGVAGGVPIHHDAVDVGELCRAVAHEHGAQRAIVVEDQLQATIEADGERLTQLVDNLVTNAIRYGTGTITVRSARAASGADCVLTVHNHGAPIDPDQLASLFDPYKRAVKKPGGIGLGLYIVEQIIRSHRGKITIESGSGETRFVINLPR